MLSFFFLFLIFFFFFFFFFFFNDTATTEIYTLSLHDALPIGWLRASPSGFTSRRGARGTSPTRARHRRSSSPSATAGFVPLSVIPPARITPRRDGSSSCSMLPKQA